MKRKLWIVTSIVMTIALAVCITYISVAVGSGTQSDPLVTQSYVDQQIALLKDQLGSGVNNETLQAAINDAVTKALADNNITLKDEWTDDISASVIKAISDNNNIITANWKADINGAVAQALLDAAAKSAWITDNQINNFSVPGFENITLLKGKKLYGDMGTVVMVLSGTVTYTSPNSSYKIINSKTSTEISNNSTLSKMTMYVFPKGQGRAIKASADSVVLVFGGAYSIGS